jgi:hypothetical protein
MSHPDCDEDTLAECYIVYLQSVTEQHRKFAEHARPRWFGLVGDAPQYQFHRAVVVANGTIIQRLRLPDCDETCAERVFNVYNRYENCITRRISARTWTKCTLPDELLK